MTRALVDQVHEAAEGALRADRDGDGDGVGAQFLLDLGDDAEVGARAVHLVDERDAGHGVFLGLAPDGLRLRLDAADGAEEANRAVEHAEAALDLDREVNVARRVDQVDHVGRARAWLWRRT